jgi:hypothetical protein
MIFLAGILNKGHHRLTSVLPSPVFKISVFACLCVARRQAPLREDVFPNNANKESLTPYLSLF